MKTATLALAALLMLGSCQSPKSKALMSLDRIVQHAVDAQEDAVKVRPHVADEGVEPFESMVGHVSAIAGEANEKARPAVEKLRNPEGWWARMWGWLRKPFYGLLAIALLLFAGQTGMIPQLAGLVSWLARKGLSISRKAVHEAALAVDVVYKDGDKSPATKEFIALKRGMDPSFDGAFKRAKQQYEAKAVKP